MGTETALRHLLRNLCDDRCWIYAVFWKLKRRRHLVLTWEDGYCDYSKLKDPMPANARFGDKSSMISFGSETYANDSSAICPIKLAMTKMSCSHYSFGQGSIGKVASTGNHSWISADECNTKLMTEYLDELELQFAAGIKTILFVPVIPHGVLQLGSLDVITEDLTMVARIKELFHSHQIVAGPYPVQLPLSKTFPVTTVATCNMPSPSKSQLLRKHDLLASEVSQVHVDNFPTFGPHHQPFYTGQNDRLNLENDIQDETVLESMYDIFPIDSKDLLLEQVPFLYSDHGGDLPSFACMTDQRLLTELPVLNSDKENPQEDGGLITNPNSLYGYDFGLFEDSVRLQVGEETKHEILSGIFDFPIDAELHEVLGAAFLNGADNNMSDIPLFGDNASENAGAACVNETTEFVEPSFGGSFGWFSEADNLDAAIANFYGNGSPTDSSGNLEASCLTNSKSEGEIFGDDSLPNFLPREHFIGSQTKCVSDLFNEEQKITKEPRYGRCGKGTNSSNMNGKRGRLSGVHKPRPRDRQLIQDCVKELRMLVPDGTKCSIDSLLGRTVKHLTFLRDVSNQAKKMKQYVDLKVGNEDHKTTGVQNHHQNGMSWAYEIGSRPSTCPIVVENLNQPGHMLVEMLCKEPELFLDIAQLIKRTGLTILKGVMEPRSDNTWARFIVEASRGFHRMEILWPLMQLLQRNGNPISGGVNYDQCS